MTLEVAVVDLNEPIQIIYGEPTNNTPDEPHWADEQQKKKMRQQAAAFKMELDKLLHRTKGKGAIDEQMDEAIKKFRKQKKRREQTKADANLDQTLATPLETEEARKNDGEEKEVQKSASIEPTHLKPNETHPEALEQQGVKGTTAVEEEYDDIFLESNKNEKEATYIVPS